MTQSDDLTVRRFELRDEDDVVALWSNVLPSSRPWNEPRRAVHWKLYSQPEWFFVGELDNRIVATALGGFDGTRGWLYSVAVAPDIQRRGIGTRMVRHVESALTDAACRKLNLQVVSTNHSVVAFYESLGFETEDRISMGKPLPCRLEPHAAPALRVNDRIHLTPLSADDKPAWLEYLNESDIFQQHTLAMPYPYTEADADRYSALLTLKGADFLVWSVRDETNRVIGGCGIRGVTGGGAGILGYWLAQPLWGQGIVSDVVRRVVAYTFDELGLNRIEAHVIPSNIASARVLEKNGFRLEGRLRGNLKTAAGEVLDDCVYGLLRSDVA